MCVGWRRVGWNDSAHSLLCLSVRTPVLQWPIPDNIYLLLLFSGLDSCLCPAPRLPVSQPFPFPFLTLTPSFIFPPLPLIPAWPCSSRSSFPALPSPAPTRWRGIFAPAPWQMWQLLELYHLAAAISGVEKSNVVSQAAGMDRWENFNPRLLLSCGSDFYYLCLWHFLQYSCQQWMRD